MNKTGHYIYEWFFLSPFYTKEVQNVESHNNFYFTKEKNMMSFDYELNKINLHGGANKGD